MTAPEDRPATAGLFIVEDGLGEATLWRRGERHPVALCRQSDVAAEVWALILAALSVAPQPQPATCKHGQAAKHFIPRGTVGAWGEWCPGPVSAAASEQL